MAEGRNDDFEMQDRSEKQEEENNIEEETTFTNNYNDIQ